MAREKIKKILNVCGTVLMVLSIAFIFKTIWLNRETLLHTLNHRSLAVTLLAALLVFGYTILNALLYKKLLSAIAGRDIGQTAITKYLRSVLYKYLPGNIFQYVGRNAIAEDGVISFFQINAASLLEILVSVTVALLLSVLLAGKKILEFLSQRLELWFVVLTLAVIIGMVLLLFLLRGKITGFLKPVLNKRVRRVCLEMALIYSLTNLAFNLCYILLLTTLGISFRGWECLTAVGCCLGAWLIGYITPGSPGGLGVREAILVVLLADSAPKWAISSAGILIRIAQIIGEVLAFVCVILLFRHRQSKP